MKKFLWALGVLAFVFSLALGVRMTQKESSQILVVEFDGKIEEIQGNDILSALSGEGGQSIHKITSNIRRAANDPNIKIRSR